MIGRQSTLGQSYIMESIKHLSDKFLIWFLKFSSNFGAELTRQGRQEQSLWREQRLRNIKGLSLISERRHAKRVEPL